MRRVLCILGGVGLAAGCAPRPATPTINTGLSTLASDAPAVQGPLPSLPNPAPSPQSDLEEILRQAALDTRRALDALESRPPPLPPSDPSPDLSPSRQPPLTSPPPEPPSPSFRNPAPEMSESSPPLEPLPTAPEDRENTQSPAAQSKPTPALSERVHAALATLADLLRKQAAESADTSLPPLILLAAIESLEGIPSNSSISPTTRLTPEEQETIDALRQWLSKVGQKARQAHGSDLPRLLAADAEELAQRLSRGLPLRVLTAALCDRVSGYGSYREIPGRRFAAGQTHRLIVYVEVDRMATRVLEDSAPGSRREPGDRYAVELSQEINLYNESGNMLALHRPEQRVFETSRHPRRDFFLVQEIALPPTLGIGRYHLKVTIRDKIGGAQAEALVPLEIVSESALSRGLR